MAQQDLYFSTDVETDGPIPGRYSMLSFASAVFDDEGRLLGTFSRNLELLPDAGQDPSTMAWWAEDAQKAAYAETRKDTVSPVVAMQEYVAWVKSFKGRPNFVAYPAGFDFLFMYWYMIAFAGESPFSFSAIDIKSYASALLKKPYRDSTKKNMPKRWFSNRKHTHVAADDAAEQGELFMNMLLENSNGT